MCHPFGGSSSRPFSYAVTSGDGSTLTIHVQGRDRWALERLMDAGPAGCTPIGQPAPRWSGYVFKLRRLGVDVETVTERHGPPFAGNHARYVLRSRVEPLQGDDVRSA